MRENEGKCLENDEENNEENFFKGKLFQIRFILIVVVRELA